jgi:radical SAM protein with 4Fe4S-binding SPASM domain
VSNIILTQECNKNCSFCFAKQFRAESPLKEMSLETVVSILDKKPFNSIRLLGGEPTEHSQFETILYLCLTRNLPVLVISNFLFSSTTRDILLRAIATKKQIGFLANAMELRNSNRIEIFKENYNSIHPLLKESKITCGFTLDGELMTPDGFDDYLDFVFKNLVSIDEIRLSLNFPGKEKDGFYFINNLELGDLIYHAVRRSLFLGASPVIDCITFPCMYRSDKIGAFIQKYDTSQKEKYICGAAPQDYMPDGTVRYCFPVYEISVDGTKYQTDSGIQQALMSKYEKAKKKITLPEQCRSCRFFKNKACAGPCLGFYNLNGVTK